MKDTGVFMVLVLMAVVFWLLSCGQGSGPNPVDTPKPKADFLIGYGLVNAWYLHPDVVDNIAEAGLTFTEIEWVTQQATAPCPTGSPRSKDWFGTAPEMAGVIVDSARRQDVTVLINIVNANDCAVTAQDDFWFLDQLDQVIALGFDHVLVSPVSEPWANARVANHWIDVAKQKIPFNHLVLPLGMKGGILADHHYCEMSRLAADLKRGQTGVVANTDCSPIVNPGPENARMLSMFARQTKSPLMIYDFFGAAPDIATINAMSE